MKAYVGIDGGGSQTRFLAIDNAGREIAQLTTEAGSKPNHYGVDTTVRVLDDGLDELSTKLEDSNYSIESIYAGIAGCASPDSLYQPIIDLLDKYSDTVKLAGDIKTNFRAASDSESGVILLAGTGSAIANFYPSGNWTVLGSVCYGAKDILFEMVMRYQAGGWSNSFSDVLEELMSRDSLQQMEEEILTRQADTSILKKLNPKVLSAEDWKEYTLFIDRIINRWVYKGFGRVKTQFARCPKSESIDVVLNGGLWAIDYLREGVISGLQRNFGESINIHYRPDRAPVQGAAILAREL